MRVVGTGLVGMRPEAGMALLVGMVLLLGMVDELMGMAGSLEDTVG